MHQEHRDATRRVPWLPTRMQPPCQDAPPSARPELPPHAVSAVAQLLICAGAAAVVGLWWIDTASVVGLAGWLTDAGRVTGLLPGYACAALVALMSRLPLLERAVGSDRLARWHALGGRHTISLVLAHTLLIILGCVASAHVSLVSQTTTLVLTYPDLLKATAASCSWPPRASSRPARPDAG